MCGCLFAVQLVVQLPVPVHISPQRRLHRMDMLTEATKKGEYMQGKMRLQQRFSKKWKELFFLMNGCELRWYAFEGGKLVNKALLVGIRVCEKQPADIGGHQYVLEVRDEPGTMVLMLQALNGTDMVMWKKALTAAAGARRTAPANHHVTAPVTRMAAASRSPMLPPTPEHPGRRRGGRSKYSDGDGDGGDDDDDDDDDDGDDDDYDDDDDPAERERRRQRQRKLRDARSHRLADVEAERTTTARPPRRMDLTGPYEPNIAYPSSLPPTHYPKTNGSWHVRLVLERRAGTAPDASLLVSWQKGKCAKCRAWFKDATLGAYYCFYTELAFCRACMGKHKKVRTSSVFVRRTRVTGCVCVCHSAMLLLCHSVSVFDASQALPWKLVHELDADTYSVCTDAAALIDTVWHMPMVDLEVTAPEVWRSNYMLRDMVKARRKLIAAKVGGC